MGLIDLLLQAAARDMLERRDIWRRLGVVDPFSYVEVLAAVQVSRGTNGWGMIPGVVVLRGGD